MSRNKNIGLKIGMVFFLIFIVGVFLYVENSSMLVKKNKKINICLTYSTDDLVKIAKKDGALNAWKCLIKEGKEAGSQNPGDMHEKAHIVGGLIYKEFGLSGIKYCTSDFAYGCYHGLLDGAFEYDLSRLPEAVNACKSAGDVGSGPFASCIHGVGHGVTNYYKITDFQNALNECDKFSDGASYCYDGVFMELSESAPKNFYKKDDPWYPCDDVESRYVFSCGRNQVSVMLTRLGYSNEEVIRKCEEVGDIDLEGSCVDAMSFRYAGESSGDADELIESCEIFTKEQNRSRCIQSGAGEFIFQGMPEWKKNSAAACAFLKGESRVSCDEYIKHLIADYRK